MWVLLFHARADEIRPPFQLYGIVVCCPSADHDARIVISLRQRLALVRSVDSKE